LNFFFGLAKYYLVNSDMQCTGCIHQFKCNSPFNRKNGKNNLLFATLFRKILLRFSFKVLYCAQRKKIKSNTTAKRINTYEDIHYSHLRSLQTGFPSCNHHKTQNLASHFFKIAYPGC